MDKNLRAILITAATVIVFMMLTVVGCDRRNKAFQQEMAKAGMCWLPVVGSSERTWQVCQPQPK